jgi:hypothetical protein
VSRFGVPETAVMLRSSASLRLRAVVAKLSVVQLPGVALQAALTVTLVAVLFKFTTMVTEVA